MKPIQGYPNYSITNDGKVFRTIFINGTVNKPLMPPKPMYLLKNEWGYYRVCLCVDGKCKRHLVHRLVLLTYKGECPDGYEAAHLDGDRTNNHISNLIWCSKKENHSHKWIHGTQQAGEQASIVKLTVKQVRDIKTRLKSGEIVMSIAKDYSNVTEWTIYNIKSGRTWKHICVDKEDNIAREALGDK